MMRPKDTNPTPVSKSIKVSVILHVVETDRPPLETNKIQLLAETTQQASREASFGILQQVDLTVVPQGTAEHNAAS